jgi:hypothetical protein
MRKKPLILLVFLLMLYIAPMIFSLSYGSAVISNEQHMTKEFSISAEWYDPLWDYRKSITIEQDSGIAGADFQVLVQVTYDSHMEADFADIRFVDDDHATLLDYWLESKNATSATFWVEVKDYLSVNVSPMTIYMYYGNDAVSTTSNGENTFLFFDNFTTLDADKWSWSANVAVSSGIVIIGDAGGYANKYLKSDDTFGDSVSLSALSRNGGQLKHNLGFATTVPNAGDQAASHCSVGNGYLYEGNEDSPTSVTIPSETWFIETIRWVDGYAELAIDRNQGVNGDEITETDADYPSVAKYVGANTWGSADDSLEMDWLFVRKFVVSDPYVSAFGEEETTKEWEGVNTAIIVFFVPVFTGALDATLIILGLIMIPASTLYLVKGGKDEMSSDKLFYVIIIFVMGWALFLGGIYG